MNFFAAKQTNWNTNPAFVLDSLIFHIQWYNTL